MSWWKIMTAVCVALIVVWVVQITLTLYIMWPYMETFMRTMPALYKY